MEHLKQLSFLEKGLFSIVLLSGLSGMTNVANASTAQISKTDFVQQSQKTVTGIVLDDRGDPVIGASVCVKGEKTGVVTDVDGKFTIRTDGYAVLVVSYLGFEQQSVCVTNKNVIRIVLVPNTSELNEVVVTALGIKREKKALGYAMQEVNTSSLTENKSSSVANMLQGKVAGVQISQSGTGLGGSTRIVMRGLNSLTGNNQPLWVVDGMPINDGTTEQATQWGGSDCAGAASEINPEDIESMSILKGANAAALYGSRAQNGAIVITTKKGRQGQPLSLEYNGNLSISDVYSPYNYQNQYGQGSNGDYNTSTQMSWGAPLDGRMVDNWRSTIYKDTRYDKYALLPQKDYITDFYRTGVSFANTLTVSAGGEYLSGRLSYTDSRSNDIVPNYSQNRQYLNMNTEFRNKQLTVGAKVSYMRELTKNRPGQGEYGLMVQLVKMPRGIRLSDLRDPRGTGPYINNSVNWSGASNNYANPYALSSVENGNSAERNRIIGQVTASYKFSDCLHLTGRAGIDRYSDHNRNFYTLPDVTSTASQYLNSMLVNKEFNADLILYFDRSFSDFSVNANLGAAVMDTENESLYGSSGKFAIPNVCNLSNGLTQTTGEGYAKKEIQSAFFAATVGYKNMAYVDVTGRNDWSSTLPKENRAYFYPSVSASVILSQMFKLPRWVTYWKVRGSWAKVGNDTDPYKLATYYYLWTTGDVLDAAGDKTNPGILKQYLSKTKALDNLKPESTTSAEFGTEAHFFDNRLSIDFTYYTTSTKNQILGVDMPGSSGYSSKLINAGQIKSRGCELMANATPLRTNDWNWDVNLNWGLNLTECVMLDSDISRYELGSTRAGKVVVEAGKKYGNIIGKAYKRNEAGQIIVNDKGLPESVSDKVVGNIQPDWTGSIGNTLRYKDFVLSSLVDIRMGGDFISSTDNYACQQGTSARTVYGRRNGEKIIVDGVTADGKKNTVGLNAETYWTNIAGPNGIMEAFVYKGTYVKMRELSLGYVLPQAWFAHTPIKYVKVSLVGRDLFYFYKAAPINPEGAFSRSDYAQAFELASMPPTRAYGLTVNVKF